MDIPNRVMSAAIKAKRMGDRGGNRVVYAMIFIF